MVGCALSVGTNRLKLHKVQYLLDNPDTWDQKVMTAGPYALTLADVHYDESEFEFNNLDCTAEEVESINC